MAQLHQQMDMVLRTVDDERNAIHTLHRAREVAMYFRTKVGCEKSLTTLGREDEVVDEVAVGL